MMKVQSNMIVSQFVNHNCPADVGYSSRHLNQWEVLFFSLKLVVCLQVYSAKNYVTVIAVAE